jgi:hypothetical protein
MLLFLQKKGVLMKKPKMSPLKREILKAIKAFQESMEYFGLSKPETPQNIYTRGQSPFGKRCL